MNLLPLLCLAVMNLQSARDPSVQEIPTLRPKVCKYHLLWAIWIPRRERSLTSLACAVSDQLDLVPHVAQ